MAVRLFILLRERTFADALAIRLESEPDMDVVAALHTQKGLPPHLFTGRTADVMLLDGDLPGNAAFRLCEEISQSPGAPRVILLSQSADPACIVRAIRAGAVGWICKNESLDRLIDVIHGVARNETWLPPGQIGEVLQLLLGGPDRDEEEGTPLLSALTDREREVLVCLAKGTRRRDVGKHLHMSPNTVRTHLQNLMGKLGVHSAIEAVALMRSQLDDELVQRHVVG
jgi:DNA-binding NarL/FixJ family response regulator